MRGMGAGPCTALGTLGWFLGVWVAMMAAMMFPSVAPTVALYSQMTKKRSPVAPLVFVSGYLVTWAAAGVIAHCSPPRRKQAPRPPAAGRIGAESGRPAELFPRGPRRFSAA
jgi:predicted metal-binding membrane protein